MTFGTLCQRRMTGGPKLGQCNLVFRFSRMNVHGDLHPEDDCIQHGAHPLLVGLTIFQ